MQCRTNFGFLRYFPNITDFWLHLARGDTQNYNEYKKENSVRHNVITHYTFKTSRLHVPAV